MAEIKPPKVVEDVVFIVNFQTSARIIYALIKPGSTTTFQVAFENFSEVETYWC